MHIAAFMKRHSVISFFILTFLISWGGILLVICGFGGLPATKEQFNTQLPVAIPAMLGGPSIAGILMTGIVSGKKGLRDFFVRVLKWRAHLNWYILALFTAPLVLIVTPLALSFISSEYLPGIFIAGNIAPLIITCIGGGILVGIFEEMGWTGFAIPVLRKRYGILLTGLITGSVWGAWHILSNAIWVSKVYSGSLPLSFFLLADSLLFMTGQLPAYRILLTWVYDRTGSLPVAMLMHASLTASTMIFAPIDIKGISLLVYTMASGVTMWLAVLIVYLASGREIAKQPSGKKVRSRWDG